ncbi:MAG TPA: nucleotidyltransferase family protein [Gemmatimonadaceae bacterium]|nr:nucleotidyltransferase family protein [Gemmatimonadaceae bacterium]
MAAAAQVSDWPGALEIARGQGLDALLVRALREGSAPDVVRATASAAVAASTARTLGQQRLLARVLGALESAGVSAIPYKGPVLAMQLYGDPTLRASVDLDVVVPFASYGAARAALVSIGLEPRMGHSARQERTLFQWLGHASFGKGTEEFVELHWRFAPLQFPFALTPEQALARATRGRLAGREVVLMATDDLVVTLAMHATRHLFERLEWLAGVTRLVLAHAGDPDALAEHAAHLRGRRILLVTAAVAAEILDAPLGARWLGVIASDPDASRLASAMCGELRGTWAGAPQLSGSALQRRYAALLDSRADRVRSVIRAALLPTEREWEAIALPDALTPLYHVVRPLRLIAEYARRALTHSAA